MKHLQIKKGHRLICLAFLASVLTMANSCTDKFNDLNIPQDRIVADKMDANLAGQAFAFAQYNSVSGLSTYIWNSALYSDRFAQYFSNIHPAFQSEQNVEAGAHKDRLWSNFYDMVATQLHFVQEYTSKNNMPIENAITKVQKVASYHRMTDHFGPMIYAEFGSGKTSVNYTSQKDMYTDFFKLLDEASVVFKQNAGKKNAFGTNDQMYKGDVNLWAKFANSLRLRLALRIVYIEPALAKTQAEKAVADGVMVSNSESGLITSTINSLNGLSKITYHEEWRMSATIHSLLVGFNDPRTSIYMSPRWDGGGYRGLRNGLPVNQRDRGAMTLSYSAVGNRWRPLYSGAWGEQGVNAPMTVVTTSEVYFLRAEGALRGWNMGGTAKSLYESGIRMAITSISTASSAAIDTYINGTSLPVAINDPWNSPQVTDIPVAYQSAGSFETQLEQIITQKWLAIFPDGWEAWAERRRTGYPVGYAIIESLNPNLTKFQLARRREYPPIEASSNAEGFKSALTLLGGPDRMDTRLWWDAKPLTAFKQPTN